MVLDSYEAGHMNWSKNFAADFLQKRGYSIAPWLPVLTGRIVQDLAASERFLWDFRKTIGELIVENHYELIGELLAKRGMKRYTESHENGRIYLADGMDVKRKADVPMAAMWQPGVLAAGKDEEVRSRADIRESASVAHIYGQNIVAGESMTTAGNSFSPHPGSLKRTADVELASGLNRFVIHTSVHQPKDDLFPGLTLGPFGQWFTRQETWADQAKVWADYLGRSSYLLQRGKSVADVLYFYGENQNITQLAMRELPRIPAGYEFDYVNSSALRDAISVSGGHYVSKGGSHYQLLVLDSTAREMTLPTLRRVYHLAKQGGKVAGQMPEYSPSLQDNATEYRDLLAKLKALPSVHFGKAISQVLRQAKVPVDVKIERSKAEVLFQHRQEATREIYWLNSRSAESQSAVVSFRVTGKNPKIYSAETGEIRDADYVMDGGRTIISFNFSPWGAQFVVFEGKAPAQSRMTKQVRAQETQLLEGPWQVKFQAGRSAPAEISLPNLIALNEHTDEGVKYFSGAATYVKSFEAPVLKSGEQLQLDLGDVKNLAEVSINGRLVRTLWKQPFVLDVTAFVHAGENRLEVKVINSWVNRLVGDAQPGAKKITYLSMPMMIRANTPTEPSGLLGPVKLSKLN